MHVCKDVFRLSNVHGLLIACLSTQDHIGNDLTVLVRMGYIQTWNGVQIANETANETYSPNVEYNGVHSLWHQEETMRCAVT
jgi:hypothetical protein